MSLGLEMSSKRRLQLIQEAQAGVYNPGGQRTMMISITGGLQPDSQFSKFRPQGYNVDAWNALVRTHSVYSGTIRFDFKQMPVFMQMLCGNAISDVTAAGVQTLEYRLPESGERDIVTFTLEDGTLASCDRCTYAFLVSLSFSSERMGDEVSGNITILCRKASATGVAMTGGVAQSETHRLICNGAAGSATIYGGAVATPGISAAALQANIRATGGVRANATVAGTNISAGAAVDISTNKVPSAVTAGPITAAWNNPADMFKSSPPTMTTSGGPTAAALIDNGVPVVCTSIAVAGEANTGQNVNVYGVNNADGYTGRVLLANFTAPTGNPISKPSLSSDAFRYFVVEKTSGGGIYQVDIFGPTGTSGTYDISGFPANTNVADIEAAPGAGWVGTVTQQGSDGAFTLPARVPMLPQNMSVRRANSFADLGAAAPMPGARMASFELSALAEAIWFLNEENETSFTAHVDGGDPQQTVTVELATRTLDANGVVIVNAAHDAMLAEANNQPATPKATRIRLRHPDTFHGFEADFFGSAKAVADIKSGNNVRSRAFPMGCVLSPDGYSARFIVKLPV